ncbi:hypothetical protein LguiB_014153 [Lonicera macranthoides]
MFYDCTLRDNKKEKEKEEEDEKGAPLGDTIGESGGGSGGGGSGGRGEIIGETASHCRPRSFLFCDSFLLFPCSLFSLSKLCVCERERIICLFYN